MSEKITSREEDYSKWYSEVIEAAGLADSSPVRGCMVIKPYGYAIWENIQKVLDGEIKETGVENAYFPLFIPKSFFEKEAEHVDGFAKECAVVTHHRLELNKETQKLEPAGLLEEPLIVRPTSETIIYHTFSKWVQSYRDLPLLINQWANVVRWEMRTRPFLRTTEFLWQEGHTAHASQAEADTRTHQMIEIYSKFFEEYLAIPGIVGRKTESEKFAGADYTYCVESMMQDGKALQSVTSHMLGQNFSKAFDVSFLDEKGESQYAWQTSWGLSTRIIGALIMIHGDDKGLIMPPKIAPLHAVIVPIWKDDEEKKSVVAEAGALLKKLKDINIKVKMDDRDLRPGVRFFEWEKKGVPVRIEIGPKDVANKSVVMVRRDNGEKAVVAIENLGQELEKVLADIQNSLLAKANQQLKDRSYVVNSKEEFKDVIENKAGFALAHWCGDAECEARIKTETKATTRCIPDDSQVEEGVCVYCGKKSIGKRVVFAKAY
jgi:prolyl-tRNA synthetase